ncbi:MAG: hypothetical protein NZ867_06240 [SAR324 cluster bacterium]|nr:hypothetical protein [SAR324 cluster bacterium]
MSHPFGDPLIDSIIYLPVVSSGMLLVAFSLGMFTLVKRLNFCSYHTFLAFGSAQALIALSLLTLFAKRMDVRHTGAGVRLMGTLKNCGKLTGTILLVG